MGTDVEHRLREAENRIRELEMQMAEIVRRLVQTGQIITLATQAGGQ